MLQAFGSLRSIVRSNRRCSESLVFYLHYRLTCLTLLFCCILISTQQFVSHKIQCLSKPYGEINNELLNNYCWAASTYSVSSAYLKQVGVHVPHAGVGGSEKQSEYEFRNFYQYVHIVLFIQAVLFYAPHIIWKSIERNCISMLPEEINTLKLGREAKEKCPLDTVAIFVEERWGTHKSLALKYLACEILATVNVLLQSYLLDVFFHGRFLRMGLLFEAYYSSDIFSDPLRLFPLVTICSFRRFGATGSIDELDGLCVLPINAINAKIFLGIWIWFAILIFLSLGNLIHLFLTIFTPVYRISSLKFESYISVRRNGGNATLLELAELADFGDWFVLCSIRKSIDALHFTRLTEKILSRISCLETEVS